MTSASDQQAWLVADAATRIAEHAKKRPVPEVGRPPYCPRDRFKLAIYCAREWYFDSINQKDQYRAGYCMAKAEHMRDLAIGIAMSQGSTLSEILPTVELFPGQFKEPPEL